MTAEELFQEARAAGIPVSLPRSTTRCTSSPRAGLMTEVVAGSGQSYFDTNPTSHYHYFDKSTGEIIDVPEDAIEFLRLPEPPPGKVIDRIDVVVRIRSDQPRTAAQPAGCRGLSDPAGSRGGADADVEYLRAAASRARPCDLDPAPVALAADQLADDPGSAGHHPSVGRRRCAAVSCIAVTLTSHRAPAPTAGSNGPSRSPRPGPRSGATARTPRRSVPAGPGAYRPIDRMVGGRAGAHVDLRWTPARRSAAAAGRSGPRARTGLLRR